MINIWLCFITVVVIHNMYENIIFIRQSKNYFEWLRKKDLQFIQDFVELRKRIEKLEMNLKEND